MSRRGCSPRRVFGSFRCTVSGSGRAPLAARGAGLGLAEVDLGVIRLQRGLVGEGLADAVE